jgi:RNA polymerase sigma factor (sigma-70 family)
VIELAAVPSTGRATMIESRAHAAEADAVAQLYDRHGRQIFRFCLHQLRKQDEAEDAVQVTFLYALRALRRGVVPVAESAWLLTIARNVCLSRFDAVRRRRDLELPSDPHVLAETAPACAPAADGPRLEEALARLPERQRRAIVMREWQGLSYAEIATELDLSSAAVETLIFRSRRALAAELREEEPTAKRRGLDLWSLLGWAKSLVGGGAAKIALGGAVVASVGTAASVPLLRSSPSRPEPPGAPMVAPGAVQPAPKARRAAPPPERAPRATRTARPRPRAFSPVAAPTVAGQRPTTTGGGVPAPTAGAPTHAPPAAPPSRPAPNVPAQTAPDSTPPVSTPAVSTPSVTTPVVQAGPVTVPSVTVPSVTVPSVTVPSVTTPAVTVPSVPPVQPPALPKLP